MPSGSVDPEIVVSAGGMIRGTRLLWAGALLASGGPMLLAGSSPAAAQDSSKRYCHAGSPLRGVYSPDRFIVRKRCMNVTGRVAGVFLEADGDYHIYLSGVNPALLMPRNNGYMTVERLREFPVRLPAKGSRVTVTGPYVKDRNVGHGWNEIHPVWHITVREGHSMSRSEQIAVPRDPHPVDPEDDK